MRGCGPRPRRGPQGETPGSRSASRCRSSCSPFVAMRSSSSRARQPASRSAARQREGLRHHAEAQRAGRQLGGPGSSAPARARASGRPRRRRGRSGLLGDLHEPVEVARSIAPVGLLGKLTATALVSGRSARRTPRGRAPSRCGLELDAHLGARGERDREGLVVRRDDDGVVALPSTAWAEGRAPPRRPRRRARSRPRAPGTARRSPRAAADARRSRCTEAKVSPTARASRRRPAPSRSRRPPGHQRSTGGAQQRFVLADSVQGGGPVAAPPAASLLIRGASPGPECGRRTSADGVAPGSELASAVRVPHWT